ncbi:unnamed protein product, partial [Ectocarpus sp. 4 AP-2014]
NGGGLVVDAALEAGGAPVHELDGALGLDGGHRGVHVLGHHVSAVHEAARHVLAVTGVALGHHAGRLEHRVGDLRHRQLLVVGLLRRDDGRVRRQHEVDAGVGHQVGLELGHVHVKGAVEPERGRQGRDHLGHETVQVRVRRPLDVKVAAAHVVQRLVVEAEGAVRVLQEGVRGQHRVVRLHHRRRHLRRRSDGEGKLGLAAVVHRQTLQQERAEPGPSPATGGVEHQETLEAGAVVRQLADAVEHQVHDLLADRVVAAGVVVGRVLLARDDLLRVVQLAVGSCADFVAHGGLQVHVH